MQVTLKVRQVGPSVSVQDEGRADHMRFGVTRSGAMDRAALSLANAALGNPTSTPAIEISLGGISLECIDGAVTIAIAGGSFSPLLNEEKLPAWSTCTLTQGDILKIRPGAWGSWCYLAFAGQIDAAKWLGSYSVHLNSGVCGKPLLQDDEIRVSNAAVTTTNITNLGDPNISKPSNKIRVVIGPQDRFFDETTIDKFLHSQYTISAEYDRMGMRLNGCTLPISAELTMPSEPISRGSLQVPGHGDPICLMADHHTAGGYPKIATVISADQDTLAQHRSGDTINFSSVSVAQAVKIARDHASMIEQARELMLQNKVSMTERLWASNLISGASDGKD